MKSKDISVINRYDVESVVSNIYKATSDDLLSKNDIADLYNKLYPCTQVDDAVKKQHIINIKNNLDTKNVKQTAEIQNVDQTAEDVVSDLLAENSEDSTEQYQTEESKTISDDTVKMEGTDEKDMVLEEPQSLKCPKCGKALVLRTAKRGANNGKQFYGCSGYPKCRYIQELNKDL